MKLTDWTEAKCDELRRLIEVEGLTGKQIGERMGISKNSVVGRAHRMGIKFPPKPYPKNRKPRVAVRKPEPAPKAIKRPLGWHSAGGHTQVTQKIEAVPEPSNPIVGPIEPRLLTLVQLKADSCRWPLGDPKQPDFRYCGLDSVEGKAYCSHHSQVAYVPSRYEQGRRESVPGRIGQEGR